MTLGQLSPLDHGEDVVGQLEQSQTVRDGRLRCADAFGDVAQREVELVDEHGEGARLFDRRQLLARDVLDEPEQERVAICRVPNKCGQRLQVRLARRPPAPLARHELVAPGGARAQDDRLDDPLHPNRLRERESRFVLEALPRLPRVRMDLVDRDVRQLGAAGASDQNLEPAAEPSSLRDGRQAPSPPSSRPPHRPSAGRR